MVISSVHQHDVFAALDQTYGLLDGSTGWSDCLAALIGSAKISGCSLFLYDCSRSHSQLLESNEPFRRETGPISDSVIDDFLWRAQPCAIWSPLSETRDDNSFNVTSMIRHASDRRAEAYAIIDRDQTHVLYLAFSGRQTGQPLDRDAKTFLSALLPHLHRACRLHCSLRGQTLEHFANPENPPSMAAANLPIELRLRRRFKLSKAEARVAKLLAEGLAPRIIADRLHVSIHTVRSQLQSIFQKTDTCRQAELTSRLLREMEIPTALCQAQPATIDSQEHRSCL